MFHLQPRVDLQEVERPRVGVQHEFHCARRAVAHRPRQPHRRVAERGAGGAVQPGGGGFLDHFLVAPLCRTVALAQGHHLATAIAEDLHLDVAGAFDELFQVEAGVLEIGLREPLHTVPGGGQRVSVAHQPHPDAAAARGALEHHGVADAVGRGLRAGEVGQQVGAGQQRHAVGGGQRAGGVLEAEGAHLRRVRADEGDAGGLADVGEGGVFREEAVAGVDGARAGGPRGGEDRVGVEVALRGRGRADAHRLVGLADMGRVGVGFGVDRDAAQAELAQRAQDAAGDGAAVGDQDGVEHRVTRSRTRRASGGRRCRGC